MHGLLILSIMFDKIIQKGRKRYGENIVNAIVEQMEKENFKKLVLVLTLTLVMALGMSISVQLSKIIKKRMGSLT